MGTPRKARIDEPGALHHVIARGIEGRKIFQDNHDRRNFIDRLGDIISETETRCFSWARRSIYGKIRPGSDLFSIMTFITAGPMKPLQICTFSNKYNGFLLRFLFLFEF